MDYVLGLSLTRPTMHAALWRLGSASPRRLALPRLPRALSGSSIDGQLDGQLDAPFDARRAGWVVERATRASGRPPARIVVAYPGTWGPREVALVDAALRDAGLPPTSLIAAPTGADPAAGPAIAEDAAAAALEELAEREPAALTAPPAPAPARRLAPRLAAGAALSLLLAAAPAAVIAPSTLVIAPSEQGDPGTGPALAPSPGTTDPALTTLPLDDSAPGTTGGQPSGGQPSGPSAGTPGIALPDPLPPIVVPIPDPIPDPDPVPDPDPEPEPDRDPVPDPEPPAE